MAPQVETNSISLASHGIHTCGPGLYPVLYGLTIVREITHQGYREYGIGRDVNDVGGHAVHVVFRRLV